MPQGRSKESKSKIKTSNQLIKYPQVKLGEMKYKIHTHTSTEHEPALALRPVASNSTSTNRISLHYRISSNRFVWREI